MEELVPLEATWFVALGACILALILLLELARTLPGQNILLILLVLAAGEAGFEYYSARHFTRVDLPIPFWWYMTGATLLWTTVVLGSRRLAQLILRPWRRERVYGLWLLFVSSVVTALIQFGWPCLNAERSDSEAIDFGKAAALAGYRAGATLILLACLFPWFIRKRPESQEPDSELAQQPENKAQ
jgi:hypothetical protein